MDDELVYVSEELADSFARSQVRRGDLIFTSWGTIGQVGVIDARAKYDRYIVSNKQMKMTPDPRRVESLYLYYYLSQPEMIDAVKSQAIGSSVPGFNLGQLRSLNVRVPDLAVQTPIVSVLGALDDKIAGNAAVARTANDLAQLNFAAAAATAPSGVMSSVLAPILGGTPDRSRSEYWVGEQLWASARDVTGAAYGVILDTQERISDIAAQTTRAKRLPAGSVILTARGTVGTAARLGVAASFNQSCYGFVPAVLPAAVLYFSVLHATDQAKAYAHGSVFSTITTSTFDHLRIPTFTVDETNQLEATLGPLLDVVTSAVRENIILSALRDMLLPELMSGRLHVQDAKQQMGEVL